MSESKQDESQAITGSKGSINMDKKNKDQVDFAELYGAITQLGIIIKEVNKLKIRSGVPGSRYLSKRLEDLYSEMMSESFLNYKDLIESLAKKNDGISEEEDGI